MNTLSFIPKKYVINSPVTALSFDEQMFLIMKWARMKESRIVCLANVHMLIEAYKEKQFNLILEAADLVTSDGMPLVWMLKLLGIRNQERIAGMDVFLRLCELCSSCKISLFFLGSKTEVLEKIRHRLNQDFPNLSIAGMESLPFRTLSETEDEALIQRINNSGAGIVMVCLGCPKQEYWMMQHRHKITAVMLGVGAVFSVYAGIQRRAPSLIRNYGFEWFYRLIQEPSRLWRRYYSTIPSFLLLALQQIIEEFNSLNSEKLKNNYQKNSDTCKFSDKELNSSQLLRIGEILLRQNLLSPFSLSQALNQQMLQKKKIGEILIEKGYISQEELKYHLHNQTIKLGDLLIKHKVISERKLQSILNHQEFSPKKLGEIMVQRKIISAEQLGKFLQEQYLRRQGLWLNSQQQAVEY